MHIGAYEPTVMYFGLTNSPATFQTMMNDLFQDLINQGDTATFIDDILVATDTEEGHNELVEEVLKRLEENDLFVKPEVQVKSERSGIPGSSNRSEGSRDAERKGGRSP